MPRKPAGRLSRKTRPTDPDEEETIPLTRATVAFSERFPGEREAKAWVAETAGDAPARNAADPLGRALLNRALAAIRADARDPLVQEVGATRALAIRIGFGDGDAIADGRWSEARDVSPPRRGRLDDVDPQERVAAVLAGRERVHPAETMLERARLDTQQGRTEEAELGLEAAREALRRYPEEGEDKLAARISEAEQRLREALSS